MHTMDIVSPVETSFWREHLIHHPDCQFAELIMSGLEDGFPIGFDTTSKLRPAKSNLISAREHPDVASAYIQEELYRGHVFLFFILFYFKDFLMQIVLH